MKDVHYVMIELFAKDGEPALLDPLVPVPALTVMRKGKHRFDPGRAETEIWTLKEGINVERSGAIIRYFFRKARHTNAFLKQLQAMEGVKRLRDNADEFLDSSCNLSFRLSAAAIAEGRLLLTEQPPCIQVKLSVAAYPKRRETARAVVERVLTQSF